MNSVIQCLSNTMPLRQYFTSGLYEQDLNVKNMNSCPGEIARELSFVVIVLSAGQYRSVSPVDFKSALGRFSSQFNGSQQQDSHELLMFLLDGLHEDINKVFYVYFVSITFWQFSPYTPFTKVPPLHSHF